MDVKYLRLQALLYLVVSIPAQAEMSGYVKSLWLETKTVIGDEQPASLGVNRWRLNWRDSFKGVNLLVSYDLEWRTGSYINTEQNQLYQSLTPEQYWTMNKRWHQRKNEQGEHGFYRAYMQVPLGALDIRLGRQQLNWSRTFLWSSFDRFNPQNPLQIETDERIGVDALQLIWNFDNGNTLEWVKLPAQSDNKARWGIRYRTRYQEVDIDLLRADFGEVDTLGLAAVGRWKNAGWGVEFTHNQQDANEMIESRNNSYVDFVFSIDYSFATETHLVTEFLYRGSGASSTVEYDWLALIAGQRTDLAKRYLGLSLRQGFQAIAALELTFLYNHDDHSSAWVPAVRYSPGNYQDLHFRIGIQLFQGKKDTEFGRQNTTGFVEAQWFY